jgi:hypothetical protein
LPAYDLGYLLVWRLQHLAQNEYCPFVRSERLQHDEHCDRDVLGKLGVLGNLGTGEQRLGQPFPHILLPAAGRRSEPVQRLSGDDPDQVGARITYLGLVDAGPPQPGILDDILGVRAEPSIS